MNLSDDNQSEPRKSKNVLGYVSIMIAEIALAISILTSYRNVLKPFELVIRIDPQMQIQHKTNLGLYVHVDLFNKSPTNGLITQVALILYKTASIENKYLLTFNSFRVIDKDGVYSASEEELPLFFEPWERKTKVMSFIFDIRDEEFPVSTGTYACELLVWTDCSKMARYVEEFKFEISADVLSAYLDRREKGSTTLEPIDIVGYTRLKSKKLTEEEYKQLH